MAHLPATKNILDMTKKLWDFSSRSMYDSAKLVTESVKPQEDLPEQIENNPFEKERPLCILCKHNIEPDYKNIRLLSQFQSRYTGRVYGRHITGLCTKKQEKLEREILKAQNAGLMGYYTKEVAFAKDPQLFDPDNPFRPHRF